MHIKLWMCFPKVDFCFCCFNSCHSNQLFSAGVQDAARCCPVPLGGLRWQWGATRDTGGWLCCPHTTCSCSWVLPCASWGAKLDVGFSVCLRMVFPAYIKSSCCWRYNFHFNTIEHFNVLSFLAITKGIVTLYLWVILLAQISRKYFFFPPKSASASLQLSYAFNKADHKILSVKQSMFDTVNTS